MTARLRSYPGDTVRVRSGAVLVLALLIPIVALASLKNITLRELVQKSDVIARGEVGGAASTSEARNGVASLQISSVLKGKDVGVNSKLPLCNQQVDSEHPDLAKVQGDYVVFAARKGECFYLVWGHDALIAVRNGRASTAGIMDQPTDQPVDEFLNRIRSLIHKQAHDAHQPK
jgi:hypothetical protein